MNEKIIHYRPKTIDCRSLKNVDIDLLSVGLAKCPWHVGDIFTDMDDRIDFWNSLANHTIDYHAPIKRKRIRENDVPYMTKDWKNAIRNKKKFAKLYAKNKTTENFELKRKYRNLASKERRKAIKEYWRKKSEKLKENPKDFFNTFSPFLSNKNKMVNRAISLKTDRDLIINDTNIIADSFANHFSNVALNIGGQNVVNLCEEDHLQHPSIEVIREYQHENLDFDFHHITCKDIEDVLGKINPKKSHGWDSTMAPTLLKKLAPVVAPSLRTLFNHCLTTCCWPNKWKMGEWTPVFKKGDNQSIENFRPITFTVIPVIGKIFEQLLCKQMTTSFDHMFYSRMSAYRKQNSCETTLISLVEE